MRDVLWVLHTTLLQGYCNKVVCNINRYQIHQTIGNESRFSLFIGQQSDECDIKDIGHDHERWVMKKYVSILSVQYSIFLLQYMESYKSNYCTKVKHKVIITKHIIT